MKNGGSAQELYGYSTVFFEMVENFAKKDIKEVAKSFITIYSMQFGEELWENGLHI